VHGGTGETLCPVCQLDPRTRGSDGEAWCVGCHLIREWGASVVEREPGMEG